MMCIDYHIRNLSKEWKYWRKYYESKGLGWNKVNKLTCKKMRKLYHI